MKINNYEEKEIIPLTDEESRSYEMKRTCHICKKEFCTDENEKKMNLNYAITLEITVTTQEILEELLIMFAILRYKVPQEIPVVIHNATYDTHFIIKQLAEEFEGQRKKILNQNAISKMQRMWKKML